MPEQNHDHDPEQLKAIDQRLTDLAQSGDLKLSTAENWAKARPDKSDRPWTPEERAKLVEIFKEELGGLTNVYAVYKENPTVDHPAEEGDRFSVDEYELASEDVPRHSGDSYLMAVYAIRAAAEKHSQE